jgi:serine/threonine-protein kinase
VFLWGSVIVAIASLASKVIYGLREEAVKAQRLGQYELLSKIGQGGMGEVYRARHALLRRPTAVKLLLPERSGQAALARFEREVRLTAKLTHPNTVAIFDYGHTPEGFFYYAMELLEGVDLEQLVAQDGAQPESRVVHILTQVCGSLAEAHGMGLVHRDIKPANIVLCERGGVLDTAKVVDFGLVKESDAAASAGDAKLSVVNTLIGTPLYMAPETIKHPETAGPSSDLYALGAVGYFLLTGSTVFSADTAMEVCAAHLYEQPERPSARSGTSFNDALETLILSCLEKDADKRPPSATALRQSLLQCGVEPWTEGQAASWWNAHPKQDSPVESSSLKNALTVNFSDRMDPTPG